MTNYRYQAQDLQRRPSCGCQSMGRPAERRVLGHVNVTSGKEDHPDNFPVAMAYVPWQKWRHILDLEKGFHCGTIFQELYKPFLGAGGRR